MITKNLNEKKLIRVKNINGCSNFGSLEIVGNTMYTIKTRSDNKLSTISVYNDYRKTNRKNHNFPDCLGHGNDITYNDGKLYVAPCSNYVEIIDVKNWKHKRLYLNISISAIAHWSGNQFIALYYSDLQYCFALLEITDDGIVILRTWGVNNIKYSEGYTISQGIGVKKSNKRIFVVFTNQDYHRNVILRSTLFGGNPDYCLLSKTMQGKYEFEGIAFRKDGYKIIGSNLPNGMDSIFLAK